ncbi:MAG TPA: hypothetical protein VJ302_34735, partial [Blastocatellia bacterium]|nr:hypothetical protein [Blastocatellia bacterium]
MPSYQFYFDTPKGEINYKVDIDDDEALKDVIYDILSELEENGHILRGRRGGSGDVVCRSEGRELDFNRPLLEQGVKPNDVLRVGIKAPSLQLRREGELYDIEGKEELREGDDIMIGRTILRFHIRNQQRQVNRGQTFIMRVQEGRSFQQTVYYMTLVGAMAGIGCWFLLSLIQLTVTVDVEYYDLIIFTLLGGFIGGLTVGFSDGLSGGGVVPRWVLMGVLAGAVTGVPCGLIAHWIKERMSEATQLADAVSWLIAGTLLGLAVSLRWFDTNRNRVLHGLLGGMFGGLLGGLAYVWIASFELGDLGQALGLALTGAGITMGISLAPVLLRQGVLEYVNSRDQGVIKRYAQNRKQWEILQGGKYVIGSLGAQQTTTMFSPELSIY